MELYESFNVVVPVASPGLAITSPSTLTSATEGSPYAYTMSAIGGQPPYSWSILSFQKQPSGTVFKFNPGQGMLSDARVKSGSTSSNTTLQGEINVLATTGTSGGWAGSPFTLYQATYLWGALEGSTLGNYTNIAGMMQDFLYLQSKCPGAHFCPGIIWANYQNVTPATIGSTVTTSAVPAYILANPGTYGAGYSGQGGYGLSGWSGSQWTLLTAAMWNANVRARILALIQAIATTVVPDGSGLTVDNHPLWEMIQDVTEYSLDYVSTGGGIANPNPTYSRAAFDTQYGLYLSGANASLQHTQFAPYILSYGLSPGGTAALSGLQTQIATACGSNGVACSNSDTQSQTYYDINWGQHLFEGDTTSNAGGTWTLGGGTDYRNVSGNVAIVQSPDYAPANANPANYPALLAGIYATAVQLKARYILWDLADESNTGLGYNFFPDYVLPFVTSNPNVTTTRPTNLP